MAIVKDVLVNDSSKRYSSFELKMEAYRKQIEELDVHNQNLRKFINSMGGVTSDTVNDESEENGSKTFMEQVVDFQGSSYKGVELVKTVGELTSNFELENCKLSRGTY